MLSNLSLFLFLFKSTAIFCLKSCCSSLLVYDLKSTMVHTVCAYILDSNVLYAHRELHQGTEGKEKIGLWKIHKKRIGCGYGWDDNAFLLSLFLILGLRSCTKTYPDFPTLHYDMLIVTKVFSMPRLQPLFLLVDNCIQHGSFCLLLSHLTREQIGAIIISQVEKVQA